MHWAWWSRSIQKDGEDLNLALIWLLLTLYMLKPHIYYIFSRAFLIHWIKVTSSPAVIFTLWKLKKIYYINKRMWRHVMNCIQRPKFERNMFKNERKCNEQNNQCFGHWIWNLFHSLDRIFLIIKILSREINYISNVKTLNIPYIFDAVLFVTPFCKFLCDK